MSVDKPIAFEAYELLAESYAKLAPTKAENAYIEQPAMRKAVGEVRGKLILEIGCGPGILAEYLISEGAKVIGFDISPKMVQLAKKKNPKNSTFFTADGACPLPLDISHNQLFDLAVSSLAIDYIKDWSILLAEIKRLLKSGGRFIFTIQHPLGSWNWYRPECAFGVQYVESVWKDFQEEPVIMPDYYRSFEEVINPFLVAGFKILKVEDLKPIDALRTINPYKFGKFSKLASFMAITVQKED